MNVLLFAGSLRTESLNKKLLKVAEGILKEDANNKVTVVDIRSLGIPLYDGDIEAQGMPDGVTKLGAMIRESGALVISSPEYNSSISSPLKNTIDWLSRLKPFPFDKKPIVLLGATPGSFGAIRAMAATKGPLEALGAYIYPQTFGLPKAGEAFTSSGELVDEATKKRLSKLLTVYLQFASKLQD